MKIEYKYMFCEYLKKHKKELLERLEKKKEKTKYIVLEKEIENYKKG